MASLVNSYQDDVEIESVVPTPLPEDSFSQIRIASVTLALGTALAKELLTSENSSKALTRVNDVRREIARETGIVFPGIHLRADPNISDYAYTVYVRDFLVARGTVVPDYVLVLGTEKQLAGFDGDLTHEPVYQLPAKWIVSDLTQNAREQKLLVFDGLSVIISHAGQVIRDHLATIFSLDCYTGLRKHMREVAPALTEEFDAVIDRRTAHAAYRHLLEETVWPRDPVSTFERMLEASDRTKDPILLAESVRKVLLPAMLLGKRTKKLQVYKLDAELEERVVAVLKAAGKLSETDVGIQIRKAVSALHKATQGNAALVLLCSSSIRRAIAEMFLRGAYRVAVYALDEIPREIVLDQKPLVLPSVPSKSSVKVVSEKPDTEKPVIDPKSETAPKNRAAKKPQH